MNPKTNRKVLDGLPTRDWHGTTTYNALLIVPTGKKHESGYHLIAIVGCDEKQQPIEIAAYCDDIEIRTPEPSPRLGRSDYIMDMFRCDMSYPAGIGNWWGARFEVGCALSSTVVTITPKAPR